jgi:hypothetical protein
VAFTKIDTCVGAHVTTDVTDLMAQGYQVRIIYQCQSILLTHKAHMTCKKYSNIVFQYRMYVQLSLK